MNSLETFRASPAWSSEHDLPLCPELNNPFIYTAYALKIISSDRTVGASNLIGLRCAVRKYFDRCRVTSGLINRWPDGRGGMTSHDEVYGAAYTETERAKEILLYLIMTDGVYINKPKEVMQGEEERYNLFRILWLRPTLQCLSGFRVGVYLQAVYALVLWLDARRYKEGDEEGRLRFWLTLDDMSDFWLSGFAVTYWRKKMHEKGLSPARCFAVGLSKYPVYAALAPDYF